MLTYIEVFCD